MFRLQYACEPAREECEACKACKSSQTHTRQNLYRFLFRLLTKSKKAMEDRLLPFLTDVTNTRNGERGTGTGNGSLGTSV